MTMKTPFVIYSIEFVSKVAEIDWNCHAISREKPQTFVVFFGQFCGVSKLHCFIVEQFDWIPTIKCIGQCDASTIDKKRAFSNSSSVVWASKWNSIVCSREVLFGLYKIHKMHHWFAIIVSNTVDKHTIPLNGNGTAHWMNVYIGFNLCACTCLSCNESIGTHMVAYLHARSHFKFVL